MIKVNNKHTLAVTAISAAANGRVSIIMDADDLVKVVEIFASVTSIEVEGLDGMTSYLPTGDEPGQLIGLNRNMGQKRTMISLQGLEQQKAGEG